MRHFLFVKHSSVVSCGRNYASHTKTMLPTRKSVPRCSRQSDHTTTLDHRTEMQIAVVWTCLPSSGLAQTILQGAVKGGRRKRRQKKMWEGNIREWTGLEFAKSQRTAGNRGKMEETGGEVISSAPTSLVIKKFVKVKVKYQLCD